PGIAPPRTAADASRDVAGERNSGRFRLSGPYATLQVFIERCRNRLREVHMVHVLRSRCFAAVFGFLAVLASASSSRAQDASKAWTVDSGVGLEIIQIKAERVADFEFLIGKIKDALQKSEDPTHKQLGDSLKVFKGADAPAA